MDRYALELLLMNNPYNFFPAVNYNFAISRPMRYGLPVLSTGVTLLVCLFLDRFFFGSLPLTPFILAVAVSAWFGGLRSGLLAAILSAVASDYFLMEPQYGISFHLDPESWERLGLFLTTCVLMSGFVSAIRAGRQEAEARALDAEQRQRELEEQIAERERAKAERERLIAEVGTERARLKAIVEHIPAGILLAEAPGGRIVMGNPQVERILGCPIIQVPDVASYRSDSVLQAEGRRVAGDEDPLARALRGEIVDGEEYLYQQGDGAKIWIRVSSAPIRDTRDKIFGSVVLISDINEEKQAREISRKNLERLTLTQKAARIGSFELNLQTNEMISSAACKANFGRAADDPFSYEDLFETIHPDDRGRVREATRQAVDERKTYEAEYRVIWPDGSLHWVLSYGHGSYGDDGRSLYLDGVTLDLTDRKRLEESLRRQTAALQEADRRKDEFLATLAHELRNPLAPISNAIQILAVRGDDPALVAQTSEVMERQVQQMVRMVDDLLEVSRIGRGKISLQKAPVDLADVVATAVETSRPLVEAHHHHLTVSLPERPVRVEGDAARLAQVLSNLLNNAAKYTTDGGRIELSVSQTQGAAHGEALLRVRDTGIGIDPELLPHIFDMFSQIEGATDRSQGGLGIGLTIVRRLVEMHGGRIEAYSEGPGKGSEFQVRLPALAEPVAAPAEKAVEDSSAGESAKTRCVLIVDDNLDSAESMAMLLRLYGHEVRLAHDGVAALEEALTFRPDVVFLDLSLPKMDGFEVARRLRSEPTMQDVKLIAMTGYSQESDRQRTQAAGFHLHLVKPVDFGMLQELLSSIPASEACQERMDSGESR
jgi:two-component system CheB/CheR fusion protein